MDLYLQFSKYSSDIVRKAYVLSDDVDEFVQECKKLDFALGSLDRSSHERVFEMADYLLGIIAHEQLRERLPKFQIADFLGQSKQEHLNADMLTTLADWLIDLQDNFSLNHETVHLSWSILFAFLNKCPQVPKCEIQLMACAAIMVASKLEEHNVISLEDFGYFSGNVYTRSQFLAAEKKLLCEIDFVVHRPNPYIFLRRYARILDVHNGYVQYMSRFLLEAGMHSYSLSLLPESKKAAACLWLARVVLRNPSYQEWARRSEVRELRSAIASNTQAYRLYKQVLKERTTKNATNDRANLSDSCISLSDSSNQPSSMLCRIPSMNLSTDASFMSDMEDSFSGVPSKTRAKIEGLVAEESQVRPYWPPILRKLTGWREKDLIPVALRYHKMAFSLIAEAASGSNKSMSERNMSTDEPIDMTVGIPEEGSNQSGSSGISNGESLIRRHLVSKYCDSSFLGVANAYPQLASENLVPFFPAVQCPENCQCGNLNFSKRDVCNKCGTNRPVSLKNHKSKLISNNGNSGEWVCKSCGNHNWAKRLLCNICNASRNPKVEERTGYGGGFMEREENVEYKDKRDSDDEYDDFGRIKRRKHTSESNQASLHIFIGQSIIKPSYKCLDSVVL
ncbi:G2/mitotic-specific cyclin-B3 [Cichlidogyrus casuarinus]|uniref:G2/mitotic-specific cyclin-B3 n=1 Tax=Cichlidogyrus casuarinus TaxID=1844966 RepID=A0ABD2Q281_9PLAT